jgi:hypothetical protein
LIIAPLIRQHLTASRTQPGRAVRVYWSGIAAVTAGQYMVQHARVQWLAIAWGVALTATFAVLVSELAAQAQRNEPRWSGTDTANAAVLAVFVVLLGIERGRYEEIAAAVCLALGASFAALRRYTVLKQQNP